MNAGAPPRAIDGFSQTLLGDYHDRLDERGRERLDRVRAATQRLAGLIDDLLLLSRTTRAEMRRERVDLSVMARCSSRTLRMTPNSSSRRSVRTTLNQRANV